MPHPWKLGDRIETLVGERDDDGEGNERHAPPGSVGEVVSVDHYAAQGWTYGVVFRGPGVWVFLSEKDNPLDDPAKYKHHG